MKRSVITVRHGLLAALVLIGLGFGWLAGGAVSHGRPAEPQPKDLQIANMVTQYMQFKHLSGRVLDDEISRRCLQTFLKSLDSMKVFFRQSDVDEFTRMEKRIDDLFRESDFREALEFAKEVFDRFLLRVDERLTYAQEMLRAEHDFSVEEEMVRDPDAATYAKSEEEANDRWRRRVKYDLLNEIADEIEVEEAIEKLHKRYRSVRVRWRQTTNDDLLEYFLSALTSGFDPHSQYLSPSTKENFEISMRLELDGIGASLRSIDGQTVVHRVIPGGAADKDGVLKAEDRIVGVGQGTEGEMIDVVDMRLNDVVKLIRGKKGTVVRLEVIPGDDSGRTTLSITRDRIELRDSEARSRILSLEEEGQLKSDGSPTRVGVIDLPSFYMDMEGARRRLPNYKSTTRDVRRLLEEFNKDGVDLVVVDLRFNGGGSLTEAVAMTGLFIERGPVVQVKGPDGRVQPYDDRDESIVWDGPLLVLINKFSASASEIFAGAIKDYDRGLVIGDKATHGKGTVQQLFDLGGELFKFQNPPNYGALKTTIQQFYRPSGDSTQSRGVLSHIELPWLTTYLDVGESDLDYAMAFDRVEPRNHDRYHMTDMGMLDTIRRRSAQRCAESDDFQKVERNIARYVERKNRKTITLNKEKFLAEREELNADKEEEETFEQQNDPDRPVFDDTFYNTEVLAIALDYLNLLNGQNLAAVH